MKFDLVFVVLVYRNQDDLRDFLESLTVITGKYKVVVVNSYFDDFSKQEIKNITDIYGCDFINVSNKGYSYGNHCGIEYALKNYEFNYLCVANPDTIVEEFDIQLLNGFEKDILAPNIKCYPNKSQNPMHVIENKLSIKLIYLGYQYSNKLLFYTGIGINKFIREAFLFYVKLVKKRKYRIFTAHGSFIVFSSNAIREIKQPFDEDIFLFGEESILAEKAARMNTKIYYIPEIRIKHKQDGSMKLSNLNMDEEGKKSFLCYYEKYFRRSI